MQLTYAFAITAPVNQGAFNQKVVFPIAFHDVEFEIIDTNGERCVTVKQTSLGLSYVARKGLTHLIARNPSEFRGKATYAKVTYGDEKPRRSQFLSYQSVIRKAIALR